MEERTIEGTNNGSRARGRCPRANQPEEKGKHYVKQSEQKGCESSGNRSIVPLNVWAKNPGASEALVWRADTVRIVSQEQEGKLLEIASACARLMELEDERRKELYEKTGRIDCGVMDAYRNAEYAEHKRILGSRNFDEVLRLVSERWKSFRELLEERRRGELPAWLDPQPPKSVKRPIIVVRFDNYRVDAQSKTIKLGYYNIALKFKGELRWWPRRIQQGRLVIVYDEIEETWYAHIASEVRIKREVPRARAKCGIDLGQVHLIAAATEGGVALLYRGSVLKSEYHYHKRLMAQIDGAAKYADFDTAVWLEKRRWLARRFKRRRAELIKNAAAHFAKLACALGVSEVYIGYPRYLSQDKPSENNAAWPYRKIVQEIACVAENFGIAVYAVPEDGTSKTCAYHGCKVVREPRGLVRCPRGHTMHADVNAALNVLKRGGGKVPERVKVLSFVPTPSGVIERKRRRREKGPYSPAPKAG